MGSRDLFKSYQGEIIVVHCWTVFSNTDFRDLTDKIYLLNPVLRHFSGKKTLRFFSNRLIDNCIKRKTIFFYAGRNWKELE